MSVLKIHKVGKKHHSLNVVFIYIFLKILITLFLGQKLPVKIA